MGRKQTKHKSKAYESTGEKFIDKNGVSRTDTFASIYESMLVSKAFMSLTKNQRLLYLYCKAQIMGKRKPKDQFKEYGLYQGEEYFYLPLQTVIDYGLYAKGGRSKFYKDMQALEDKGFIEKMTDKDKHFIKAKNIYKLDGKWKDYS